MTNSRISLLCSVWSNCPSKINNCSKPSIAMISLSMLGLEQLSIKDQRTVNRARRLERFLTQPFYTTEQFSQYKGRTVSLEDALTGCERILSDEFNDFPESYFYMIGTIDEVIEKAELNL